MGVITSGILGPFSGRVGNVVGGSWKGIAYMRILPASVANPRTAAQVENRNAFKGVVEFASAINAAIIKPLWDRFQVKKSGNNAFVSANKDTYDGSGILNEPENLIISRGSLTGFDSLNVVQGGSIQEWDASWTDNSGTGSAAASDEVYGVAYNQSTGEIVTSSAVQQRNSESLSFTFQQTVSGGNNIYFWFALRRTDGTLVSDTSYDDAQPA